MGARSGILRTFVSIWPAPRALLQDEWPALRVAINRIFRPSGGDLTHELPLLFDDANRDNLRVVVDDTGAIVAHAGCLQREAMVLRRRITVGFIAAVFTDPAARGQRLGTRVLLDALARTRMGADLVLASGDRDLYRRQGFEPVAPLARFRLPPALDGGTNTRDFETRELSPADLTTGALAELMAMHDAEVVHFVRSADDWTKMLTSARLVDAPATLSLVTRAGRAVAFVAAQKAQTRPDGSTRPRRLLEIAGDRGAIIAVAPRLGEELLVPSYDSATLDRAAALGWVRTTRQFQITAEPLTAIARVVPWYGLNYL